MQTKLIQIKSNQFLKSLNYYLRNLINLAENQAEIWFGPNFTPLSRSISNMRAFEKKSSSCGHNLYHDILPNWQTKNKIAHKLVLIVAMQNSTFSSNHKLKGKVWSRVFNKQPSFDNIRSIRISERERTIYNLPLNSQHCHDWHFSFVTKIDGE